MSEVAGLAGLVAALVWKSTSNGCLERSGTNRTTWKDGGTSEQLSPNADGPARGTVTPHPRLLNRVCRILVLVNFIWK